MLRLIAEKERRCFELREELASEELQLKQLRTTWQRLASKDFPSFSSHAAPSHRRDASTASSTTSEVASEAWNSLSSKLPGLKTQLNSLLESMAGVEQVPEPVDKDAGLRVTGGLGVLEEEGSDVASVVSRSPRSPAVGVRAGGDAMGAVGLHEGLKSMAAVEDSKALGFTVDSNGLARANEEVAPPTPPKPTTTRSSRTSVFGSLGSKLLASSSDQTSTSTGSFTSILAKRLKEAQQNASDMLREAERKLGNAMTIDDLLGNASTARSPAITLDEPSTDSAYSTSWVEAVNGQRGLKIDTSEGAAGRRLSSGSSRSAGSKGPASPVIGGAPGAAVFGMVLGSQSDVSRSEDGWGWNGGDDEAWGEEVRSEVKR